MIIGRYLEIQLNCHPEHFPLGYGVPDPRAVFAHLCWGVFLAGRGDPVIFSMVEVGEAGLPLAEVTGAHLQESGQFQGSSLGHGLVPDPLQELACDCDNNIII